MAEPATRRRRKRGWAFKLMVFTVLAGSIGGFSWLALKKEDPEETFATTEVGRGDLVDKLADTGRIELVRTVEVKSTIAGEVRLLPIEAGDHVERGQLLAVIEPDPNQSLQLYQKRSNVERSQLSVEEQEREFERQKSLFERRMLSTAQFEDSQMRLTRAQNELRLARLELEIIETKANLAPGTAAAGQTQLDEVRVEAPISGIVIRRGVEIGEVVASGLNGLSGGTVMFEIGDPSQMIVRGDIAEIDIAKLEVGQPVDIVVDAYPDTTYAGRVRWIAPVGLQQQGSPIVTFDTEIDVVDHEPRLRQGMSCDIDIIFTRRDSVLFLPVEAVMELFDEEAEGQQIKGKRGRFVTWIVRPDTSGSDSLNAVDPAFADGASAVAVIDTVDDGLVPMTIAPGVDSTAVDAAVATADSTTGNVEGDSTAIATSASAAAEPPTEFVLERFEEVTLQIGLETSTRIEILSGLQEGDRIAADPRLIARKKKEAQMSADASADEPADD